MPYETFVYKIITDTAITDPAAAIAASSDNNIDLSRHYDVLVTGILGENDSSDGWLQLSADLTNGSINRLIFKSIYGGPKRLDLITVFQNTKSLNEITFDDATFHQSLSNILTALCIQPELSYLSILNYEEVSRGLLTGIANAINKSTGLETLKLNNLNIEGAEGFKLICDAIANSTTLKHLEVSNLSLSASNLSNLSNALAFNKSIDSLVCNGDAEDKLHNLIEEALINPKRSRSNSLFKNDVLIEKKDNPKSTPSTFEEASIVRSDSFISRHHFITTANTPKEEKKKSCCLVM